jgi:hypothetical protein
MNRLQLFLAAIAIFIFSAQSWAQSLNDSLLFADRVWALKKKAVVLEYLQMTEAEKASFWPVYEGYHTAIRYLEMEYIYLNATYINGFKNLSGNKLEELSSQILKNDFQLAKLRKIYFKKFKKAISPELASSFMQLDQTWRIRMREELLNQPVQTASLYSRNL